MARKPKTPPAGFEDPEPIPGFPEPSAPSAALAVPGPDRPWVLVDGTKVNEVLIPFLRATDDLVFASRNARLHAERNLAAIRGSLQQFGFQAPVVFDPDTKEVIAGNGRLAASRSLGWARIPAIPFRGTEAERTAFALIDNRSAELADWDWQIVGEQVRGLLDQGWTTEQVGWQQFELDPVLQADWEPPDVDEGEGEGEGGSGGSAATSTIEVTAEQRQVIDRAIERLRAEPGMADASDGRSLELICADYLGGR